VLGPALGVVELAGGDRRAHEPQQQTRLPGRVGLLDAGAARGQNAVDRPLRVLVERREVARGGARELARLEQPGQARALTDRALGLGRLAAHVMDERADPEREVQQVGLALQARGVLGGLGLGGRRVEFEQLEQRLRPHAEQRDERGGLAGLARELECAGRSCSPL